MKYVCGNESLTVVKIKILLTLYPCPDYEDLETPSITIYSPHLQNIK